MIPGTVKDKSEFGSIKTEAYTHPRETAALSRGRMKVTFDWTTLVAVGMVE
jgi:hypothetical protein